MQLSMRLLMRLFTDSLAGSLTYLLTDALTPTNEPRAPSARAAKKRGAPFRGR